MFFRGTIAILLLVIVAQLLSACSLGESPEGGAKAFMEAVGQMDGSKMLERTCQAQQKNASNSGTMAQAMISALMMFGGGLGGAQLKIDVSGLQYTTVNQSGNNASVRISGVIRSNVGLAASEQPFNQTVPMLFEDSRWKVCG
jgi:hypothetical protein